MRERQDLRANAFDLLRLIGALAVLIHHSWELSGHGHLLPGQSGTSFGRIGVGIFFLTSGYLITASWFTDPSPWRFAVRRALRIYPLYAVVIVGLALVVGPLLSVLPPGEYFGSGRTWTYLFHNLLFLVFPTEFTLPGVFTASEFDAVNGAIWTIPTEVLCYIGVLVLGVAGALRRRWIVAIAVALGAIVATVVLTTGYDGPLVPRLVDAKAAEQIALFGVGMAAFVFLRGRRLPLWVVPVVIVAWAGAWGTPLADIAAVAAIAGVTLTAAFRAPSVLHRPTGAFDLSYGMYLFGYPVQQVLVEAGVRDGWLVLGLTLLIVMPLAAASWRLVEQPALRLKPARPGRE